LSLQTNPQHPKLLSIQESADYFGVHKNTIRNLLTRKELKAVRIGARIVRISQDDLEALLKTYESGEYGCWKTNS
jgi:excisionase family DNA binding protein